MIFQETRKKRRDQRKGMALNLKREGKGREKKKAEGRGRRTGDDLKTKWLMINDYHQRRVFPFWKNFLVNQGKPSPGQGNGLIR